MAREEPDGNQGQADSGGRAAAQCPAPRLQKLPQPQGRPAPPAIARSTGHSTLSPGPLVSRSFYQAVVCVSTNQLLLTALGEAALRPPGPGSVRKQAADSPVFQTGTPCARRDPEAWLGGAGQGLRGTEDGVGAGVPQT